jgi:hypothetical protein
MPSPALAVIGNEFHARYLAAKKTIDDRALNRHVWDTLRLALPQAGGCGPIKILEIGAGIGTMLARVIDWGLLAGPATYVITDCVGEHLLEARHYLATWAERQGHALAWQDERHGRLRTAGADVSLVLVVAGAEELADGSDGLGRFQLLLAHAVLDLLDFPVVLPKLLLRLEQRGLAYLTCNFDGETIFLPEYAGAEEPEILRRYHDSMDMRLPRASHTGRRLLTFLQGPGLELLAAGSSDWLVHPQNGRYRDDEAFFLQTIIATVQQELAGKNGSSPSGLSSWAGLRHRQVETGELSFLARHLDLLARRCQPQP